MKMLDYGAVVAFEQELFSKVKNRGGRATCQDNEREFAIMRMSQLYAWTPAIVESYFQDLKQSAAVGRNLLADKYAYMMRSTHPEEYERIQHQLEPVGPDKGAVIEEICRMCVTWAEDASVSYPYLMQRGRPIRSSQDALGATSLETYMRGELCTYSLKTLRMLKTYYQLCVQDGINVQELADSFMVRCYGYATLADAERSIRGHES